MKKNKIKNNPPVDFFNCGRKYRQGKEKKRKKKEKRKRNFFFLLNTKYHTHYQSGVTLNKLLFILAKLVL